jgi:hypothetical protein
MSVGKSERKGDHLRHEAIGNIKKDLEGRGHESMNWIHPIQVRGKWPLLNMVTIFRFP